VLESVEAEVGSLSHENWASVKELRCNTCLRSAIGQDLGMASLRLFDAGRITVS